MLTVKYFAYGSNISYERLKSRVQFMTEPLKNGEPYVLNDYELVFNAGIDFGLNCFANIMPRRGAKVEGILYTMTPAQFSQLDRYEMFYEKHYFIIDGETLGCVYIAKQASTCKIPKKPDLTYLNVIIDGCKEQGLETTYKKLVKFKMANYRLKKSKHSL